MKHVIAVLGTLSLVFLCILPIIVVKSVPDHVGAAWAIIYFPLGALILFWGFLLDGWYKDK